MLGLLFILLQFFFIFLACVYICVMVVTEQKFNKHIKTHCTSDSSKSYIYIFRSRFLELFHMAVTIVSQLWLDYLIN